MAAVSLPSPFNHVCTPIVSAEPAYRGHRLKGIFSKPKSANEVEDSVTLLDLSDISVKCSTPYRLPRIPPPESPTTTVEGGDKSDLDEKIFGRFGYEDVVKMPELGPSIRKALINPHSSLAQRYRQAAITPAYRHAPFGHHPQHQHVYHDDDVDDEYDQHSMFKSPLACLSTGPGSSPGAVLQVFPDQVSGAPQLAADEVGKVKDDGSLGHAPSPVDPSTSAHP
ncbi:hypothetical protein EGW08_001089 [Elysia chlorotica]|uniref:Uncharacterized protein n=1 Tax=Elysia chlorotica TaxID=188477 RepID=A0A3S1I2V4_ELYCH|nr:hypothetical protein EGW08_001089 [Elysia chlorotica]